MIIARNISIIARNISVIARNVSIIARNVGYYLDILVLLRQDVVGKDLVNGDAFCVCPRVPCKCKTPSK